MLITYQNIVKLIDSVNLGQQLVDDGIVDSRVSGDGASSLTDGVNLVEDDDVEAGVCPHPFLLLLSISEQPSNVGLGFTNVFVKDLFVMMNVRERWIRSNTRTSKI